MTDCYSLYYFKMRLIDSKCLSLIRIRLHTDQDLDLCDSAHLEIGSLVWSIFQWLAWLHSLANVLIQAGLFRLDDVPMTVMAP